MFDAMALVATSGQEAQWQTVGNNFWSGQRCVCVCMYLCAVLAVWLSLAQTRACSISVLLEVGVTLPSRTNLCLLPSWNSVLLQLSSRMSGPSSHPAVRRCCSYVWSLGLSALGHPWSGWRASLRKSCGDRDQGHGEAYTMERESSAAWGYNFAGHTPKVLPCGCSNVLLQELTICVW